MLTPVFFTGNRILTLLWYGQARGGVRLFPFLFLCSIYRIKITLLVYYLGIKECIYIFHHLCICIYTSLGVDEIEIFSIPFILKHKYDTLFRIVKFELGSLSVLVRTQVWIFMTKVKLSCNTHLLRGERMRSFLEPA